MKYYHFSYTLESLNEVGFDKVCSFEFGRIQMFIKYFLRNNFLNPNNSLSYVSCY